MSRNKQWIAEGARPHNAGHSDDERSQRGGRGRGRGQFRGGPNVRKFPNMTLRNPPQSKPGVSEAHTATVVNAPSVMVPAEPDEDDDDEPLPVIEEPELDPEAREALYQEVSFIPIVRAESADYLVARSGA